MDNFFEELNDETKKRVSELSARQSKIPRRGPASEEDIQKALKQREKGRSGVRGDIPAEGDRIENFKNKLNYSKTKAIKSSIDIALEKLDSPSPILTDQDKQIIRDHYNESLAKNDKTQVAIDFMAGTVNKGGTCFLNCDFCYVLKALKMRAGWTKKLKRLTNLIKNYPDIYNTIIQRSISEYLKSQTKSGTGPHLDAIRWFGSGDYQPYMKPIIKKLAEEFGKQGIKFYIISKTLVRDYAEDVEELAKISNVYINLSFSKPIKSKLSAFQSIKNKYKNVQFCYTLDKYEGIELQQKTGIVVSGEQLRKQEEEKTGKSKIKKTMSRKEEFEEVNKMLAPAVKGFQSKKYNIDFANSYLGNIPEAQKITLTIRDKSIVSDLIERILDNLPDWQLNKGLSKGWTYVFTPKSRPSKLDGKPFFLGYDPKLKKRDPNLFDVPAEQIHRDKKQIQKKKKVYGWAEEPEYLSKMFDSTVSLTPEYIDLFKRVDIVFNVNRQGEFMKAYYTSPVGGKFCECDLKIIHEHRACVTTCRRCYQGIKEPNPKTKNESTLTSFLELF